MMMTVVAIIAVPVVPVVWPRVIGVRIGSVVSIWIIAAVRVITVSVSRISDPYSDSPNANRDLSVRPLDRNESEPDCHQSNE
jgi:hypothetical protein